MTLVIGEPGCASRGLDLLEDEGRHTVSQGPLWAVERRKPSRLPSHPGCRLGAVTRDYASEGSPRPLLKPSRQLGHIKFKPKACLALAFEAPRTSVMNMTASPIMKRAIQAGIPRGGLAPSASARAGSHCDTGAGSSSTML